MKKRMLTLALGCLLAIGLTVPAYAAPSWEPTIPGTGRIGYAEDGNIDGLVNLSFEEGFAWWVDEETTDGTIDTDGPYQIQNLSSTSDMTVTLVSFNPDPGNPTIPADNFEFHFTGDLAISGDPDLNIGTGDNYNHQYTDNLEAASDWNFNFAGSYDAGTLDLDYPATELDYTMVLRFEIAP